MRRRSSFRVLATALIALGCLQAWACLQTVQAALRPRVAVLTYHEILPFPDSAYAVTPQRLERDLRWLLAGGWQPLTLQAFQEWMQGRRQLSGDHFLLTFDDGYASLATGAAPVLRRLKVPATAFLITGHLGPVDRRKERPKLTPEQVRTLVDGGLVSFGSHTDDLHYDVTQDGAARPAVFGSTPAALAADLDASVRRLTGLTGRAPPALAWPGGVAPEWAQAVARERFPLIFGGAEGFVRQGALPIPRFAMEWRGEPALHRRFGY